jgi:hypothetical protein
MIIMRKDLVGLLLLSWMVCLGWAKPFPDCPAVGTVSRIGQQNYEDRVIEAPPSPAPSQAHVCNSHTSNARGHYTSTVAPCRFSFHKSIRLEDEMELIDYQTSDLCSDDNGFLTMEEYITDWPDECVGDFDRCYSVEHHRKFFDFMCAMDNDWHIPDGTTHVSVNCTEDRKLVLKASTHQQVEEKRETRREKLEVYELKLFNIALILASCVAGVYAISHWIVKPLLLPVGTAESSLTLNTNSAACGCGETCHCAGAANPETQNLVSEDDDDDSYTQHEEFHMQIPLDFDAVPILQAILVPGHD